MAEGVAAAIAAQDAGSATDDEVDLPELYEGALVVLVNLVKNKHLNGDRGRVLNRVEETGRWRVMMLSGLEKNEVEFAKRENLFLEDAVAKGDKASGVKRPRPEGVADESETDGSDAYLDDEDKPKKEKRITPWLLTRKKEVNKKIARLEKPVPKPVAWDRTTAPVHAGVYTPALFKQAAVYVYGRAKAELHPKNLKKRIEWSQKYIKSLDKASCDRKGRKEKAERQVQEAEQVARLGRGLIRHRPYDLASVEHGCAGW